MTGGAVRIIALAVVLAPGLLAAPLPAPAQQPSKVFRIGYLGGTRIPHLLEAFLQGLRERGYVDGQNIIIEYRWAEGRIERYPALAAELVRLKVDIIVTGSVPGALAARDATKTIPIIVQVAGSPVETGLVASLARPGGNVTGIAVLFAELSAKRLELLKETLRKVSRVAVLWNSANPAKVADWRETQAAARVLRVTLQSREVRGPDDFESVFTAITRERPDALITLDDILTLHYRQRIVDFAAKSRLPAIYALREFVDAGGLMSYAVNLPDILRRSATHVDKILKGAKPADLPVEQATRFELVINLKTAKALGLTIPQAILIRADEVIR